MRSFPIAPDAWPYVLGLGIIAVIFYYIWPLAAVLPVVLLLFILWFFRNPPRRIPEAEDLIVSPADGVVMSIEEITEDRFLQGPAIRVQIFLNIFNVHINRTPIAGTVKYRNYRPGKFIPAFKSHASDINEKNYVGLEGRIKVMVTQVTGLIARRIVCWVGVEDRLARGERFGLIKFGSMTEIFYPLGQVETLIQPGTKVRGGKTVIGRILT